VALAALLLGSAVARAQEPTAMRQALVRADSAFVAGSAPGSLSPLQPWLDRDVRDAALLWRAARGHVALGILTPTREGADAHYQQAAAHARAAIIAAPSDPDAVYWLAVAQGRRALRGNFHRILPLAVETHTLAQRVLALDPRHAGAHGILGKLYSEVRKLPWMIRKLAAAVTRQDVLRLATWEAAERHLHRAIALDSLAVIHHADLVQLYVRQGRLPAAREAFAAMRRLPNRTPADTLFRREVRSLLELPPPD
jgi:tetratricopeptide (TPR) repeat protein